MTRPPDAARNLAKLFEQGGEGSNGGIRAILAPKVPISTGRMQAHSNLNLRERYLASVSPLLITMAGTHWTDWTLYQRSLVGLPSVVIGDHQRDFFLGAPPPPPLFRCAERGSLDCSTDCTFHRSVCINRTDDFGGAGDFGDALDAAPHGGRHRIADAERPDGIVYLSFWRSKLFESYVSLRKSGITSAAPARKALGG